jgi:hypothetical protein
MRRYRKGVTTALAKKNECAFITSGSLAGECGIRLLSEQTRVQPHETTNTEEYGGCDDYDYKSASTHMSTSARDSPSYIACWPDIYL